jgi:hypothetical protein
LRKKRNLPVTFAVGALVAGAGVLANAAPASAHDRCRYLSNERGNACVFSTSPHHWVRVCDTKADNWGVRVYVYTNKGQRFAADGNGSADGCGGYHTVETDEQILAFTVCAGENGKDTECASADPA